jgi:hypothetical protein
MRRTRQSSGPGARRDMYYRLFTDTAAIPVIVALLNRTSGRLARQISDGGPTERFVRKRFTNNKEPPHHGDFGDNGFRSHGGAGPGPGRCPTGLPTGQGGLSGNPHFPDLRSGHRLFQRPSTQKQIPCSINIICYRQSPGQTGLTKYLKKVP